jgi:hypothetical protein
MTRIEEALQEYMDRQSRRHHPRGTFDKAGRWYPDAAEEQACCGKIRTPSRAYPYSYMTHCRTAEHVAALYGVDVKDLRKAIRQSKKAA